MRLPDPNRTQVVLVGVSNYDLMPDLPAVARNVDALRELFTDPAILGLPPRNCHVLHTPTTVDEVLEVVHRAASAALDTLVLYFAGHGVLDGRTAELRLCLRGGDSVNLHKTILFADLRRIVLDATDCEQKVVILDCCHSGSAIGAMSDEHTYIADQSRIEGTYVMTSTSAYDAAMAPVDEQYTAFSAELISALDAGLPHATSLIDVDALYFHVRSELAAKNYPIPHQRSRNEGRKIVLARNKYGDAPVATREMIDRELPELPAGYEAALATPPSELAVELRDLARRDRSTADALLDALAVQRPDQEVAALIEVLTQLGHDHDVQRLLGAAMLRPQQDVALLLAALREMNLTRQSDDLLHHLAESGGVSVAAQVAELRHLHEHELVRRLLDTTVKRSAEPPKLVGLITALWAIGLRDDVDDLLERNVSTLSAAQVVELADALRVAGREEEAFKLYGRSMEKVAGREAAEVTALVAAMAKAGDHALADRLMQAVSGQAQHDPERLYDLFQALQHLDEEAAARLLGTHWQPASGQEVGALARLLRDARHYHQAQSVCLRATTELPGAEILILVDRLRSEGRPIDAHRVLETAGRGGANTARLAELLSGLHAHARSADLHRVSSCVGEVDVANEVVAILHSTGHLEAATAFVAASPMQQGSLKTLLVDRVGEDITALLESLHPALAAQLLLELDAAAATDFLKVVRYETAADIITATTSGEVSREALENLVDFLQLRDRQRILGLLAPAVLGRLIAGVPAAKSASLLALLSSESAVDSLLSVSVEAAAETLAAVGPLGAYRSLVAVENSQAAAWLAGMGPDLAAGLMAAAQPEKIAAWLGAWPSADVAAVLLALPSVTGASVLSGVEPQVAAGWLQGLGPSARPLFASMPWRKVTEIRACLDGPGPVES
ncbi:hypothetical protein DDE19_13705 [Micromonospora ureilytica]|uniref:Peptidase C14 caspase domain-containing protein n=1 Tax=Micromonospora ureilytica TaxID=709868 RepID=A0A3N9XUN3_9ACTN|nr:caspase family protein [Micromonospora ureilytica]RQX16825.1 hypothetical protein DDE19_13705 [Micromonospora ureilytica]